MKSTPIVLETRMQRGHSECWGNVWRAIQARGVRCLPSGHDVLKAGEED